MPAFSDPKSSLNSNIIKLKLKYNTRDF